MLSTLHSCSNLGVKNDLELFQIQPTQFSHEGYHYQEFYPTSANYQKNEAITFRIPNVGEQYLDPSSIFLHVRGRVVGPGGVKLVSPTPKKEGTSTEPDYDKVYPCDNFVNSLFETCDIFLNDIRISHNELYTYRSFLDLLTESNVAMRTTLWPLCYSPDETEQTLDFKHSHGITERYSRIKESREIDLATPLFTDLSQQGKLLPSGVTMRITLKQNPDKFRLITAATEARDYKFEILEMWILARFVSIASGVRLAIEKTLHSGQNALYLLRGVQTKYRAITSGKKDIVLEDLSPGRVPAKLTFLFVRSDAVHGNFKLNPLKFENLKMNRSTLTVGNREIEETYDFNKDFYAWPYMNFIRQLNNPLVHFSKGQYEKNHFMLHYVLTPDGTVENLSPCTSENVRLTVELSENLAENYTCIIVAETPTVLEIDAARNIHPSGYKP
jgi:hypothetical protein